MDLRLKEQAALVTGAGKSLVYAFAGSVAFVASERASFITGSRFDVNGGRQKSL